MARSVYKICSCRDRVKCRHPWWFSYQPRGRAQLRKSLDVVLEKHVESKTIAEQEAERLRLGIIDDTLTPRTRELLGLPPSAKPILPALTVHQLLDTYRDRQLRKPAPAATSSKKPTPDRIVYHIGAISRTVLARPDGTTAALGDWFVSDVTADTLERLREARAVQTVRPQTERKATNRAGGTVAANRDLRLLRAAWNWAIRMGLVERSPFKRGTEPAIRLTAELARSRRLGDGEGDRLLAACDPPRRVKKPKACDPPAEPKPAAMSHLRAIVEAALETGCRKGELLSLQWSQVQLEPRAELWLPAGKTKTGKARRVPISTRLQAILAMRRNDPAGQPLPDDAFVLGDELGRRHGAIKTAWRLACARAKIADLHFHDLRREAGSRWMDAGVPLAMIQRWLGHTNIAQTSTYLSGTTAGEHDAMRRFEAVQAARLIPIDTGGGTPLHSTPSPDMEATPDIMENPTRH